jgi:Polyketide cyclase / dehydrase and lipid transport
VTGSVELGGDRSYRFPIMPDALWTVLAETGDYRGWWPWLTHLEADGLVAGAQWRCTLRPPLPFELRFAIHLDDVVRPRLVTAHISGDIAGTSRLDVTPNGGGCDVQLVSTLAPSRRTLEVIEPLVRPIIRRAHNWVLDTGARQFLGRAITHQSDP